MAMAVEDRLALEARQGKIFGLGFQEFAEQKSLARKGLRTFIVRKQVDQLVAEDGDATGLKPDHRNSSFDFGRKFIENLQQQRLRTIEHAVIVERTSATQVGFGDDHVEP